MLKGDAPAALAEIEQEKNETWRMVALPMAYCALGRAADADTALDALIAKYEKDFAYNIAYVYAAKRIKRSNGSTRRSLTRTRDSPKSRLKICSTKSAPTRAGYPSCAR